MNQVSPFWMVKTCMLATAAGRPPEELAAATPPGRAPGGPGVPGALRPCGVCDAQSTARAAGESPPVAARPDRWGRGSGHHPTAAASMAHLTLPAPPCPVNPSLLPVCHAPVTIPLPTTAAPGTGPHSTWPQGTAPCPGTHCAPKTQPPCSCRYDLVLLLWPCAALLQRHHPVASCHRAACAHNRHIPVQPP
jgi:hypothetical protein